MVSVALPVPTTSRENAVRPAARLYAVPIPHPPESMDGIPYYDDELAVAQSIAHIQTILFLCPVLNGVAKAAGLRWVSDNPVWYRLPEEGRQRALYPDYALTAQPSVAALTANDLRLALEVVSTAEPAKAHKDTVVMRERNAAHGVPEFVLLYPEPEDERAVVWHRLDEATGRYRDVSPSAAGRYRSTAIPGLEIEVLPRADWSEGRKVRVWFRGEEVRDREAEAQAREVAEQQAHRAEQQAAQEQQARQVAEQQAHRAEQQAAQERQARLAGEQEIARLLARLQQAGLDRG